MIIFDYEDFIVNHKVNEGLFRSEELRQEDFKLNKDRKDKRNLGMNDIDSDFYKCCLFKIDTSINNLKNVLILNTDLNCKNEYFKYDNIYPNNIEIIDENL